MKLIRSCSILLVLFALNACCMVNAQGRRTFAFYPNDRLNAQADLSYAEQKKKNPRAKNKQHEAIVKRVANRLITIAKRDYPNYCKGFSWEVVVFEKPKTLNAWCMPGGRMAVYTGILKACENEAALAAVMGHEIAHALLEHGNERLSQALTRQGLTMVAILALEGADISREEKKNFQLALGAASAGGELVMLKFSRNHESEADEMGLKIMASAGYDPKEAPKLWVRMGKISGGQKVPELLSTHPSHDTRIAHLKKLQLEVAPLYQAAPTKYGLGYRFFK